MVGTLYWRWCLGVCLRGMNCVIRGIRGVWWGYRLQCLVFDGGIDRSITVCEVSGARGVGMRRVL